MKRFVWQWLVASSLLLGLVTAETRPEYGGALHMSTRAALSSLDPADRGIPDTPGRRSITGLIFDTLVTASDSGGVKPGLAESWQLSHGNRCQIWLRRGVKFHDGSTLTPESAAASLRFANPSWNVQVSGDALLIEADVYGNNLLAELALARNAIVKRDVADGTLIGTGPFHIVSWDAGKKVTLGADENHWRGRPYLDRIEIELDKSFRDQSTASQMGRTDLLEIAPEQSQHSITDGRHMAKSAPLELLALLFTRDASSPEEKSLRNALAFSVERSSIYDVLLKRAGQPTGSILPTWISGYGFVFASSADLARARQLRREVRTVPSWKLGYDGSELLDRLVAERIALNARDAGLSVLPTPSAAADIRLERIPLASSDPWIALENLLNQYGITQPTAKGNTIADLYASEREVLASGRLIPLFHLPVSYASSPALRNWAVRTDGSLDLSNAWLETTKP